MCSIIFNLGYTCSVGLGAFCGDLSGGYARFSGYLKNFFRGVIRAFAIVNG